MSSTTLPTKLSFWSEDTLAVTTIVLISGKISAGKTTVAGYMMSRLTKKYKYTYIIPFAAKIKEIAAEYYMWDMKKDVKGRNLLQQLGKAGRDYFKDLWVEWVITLINDYIIPPDVVIIDDWRFPNEYKKLEDVGQFQIIKIRVLRDNVASISTDVSETSLTDDMDYDYIINNDGTL